ncbi:MAG: hypothetical protein WD601_06290 [Pseudohongiellaceae bacterium]
MTDILDKIDESLEEVEEQLLGEFTRIRKNPGDGDQARLEPGITSALRELVGELKRELEHSGDRQNLQLLSERHEVLYARLGVLDQLLTSKIPLDFLRQAHDGLTLRRTRLEERAIVQRQKRDPAIMRQSD